MQQQSVRQSQAHTAPDLSAETFDGLHRKIAALERSKVRTYILSVSSTGSVEDFHNGSALALMKQSSGLRAAGCVQLYLCSFRNGIRHRSDPLVSYVPYCTFIGSHSLACTWHAAHIRESSESTPITAFTHVPYSFV